MKRRWRLLAGMAAIGAALVLVPLAGVELGCRPAGPRAPDGYRSLLPPAERRAQARTWLTYPEWHIVYSAESFGRHLAAGRPPSGYDYGADVAGFWGSYCAINRLAGGAPGAGEAKLMIYVIGISFTVELAVKAAWENLVGRATEWLGGWRSPEDRYAADVQGRYGRFLHEVPWYRFGFGEALAGLWRTHGPWSLARRPERRIALSAEYLVKLAYARALGAGMGATMAPDERSLRMVVRADPARVRAADVRLRPVATLPGGRTVVEAPRYGQFTDLARRLAAEGIAVEEIAGNRRILVTVLAPDARAPTAPTLVVPLGDRPGWSRYGLTLPVGGLTAAVGRLRASGAELEHVYDY